MSLAEQEQGQIDMIRLMAMPEYRPAALEVELAGPWYRFGDGPLPVVVQVGTADDGRLICTGVLIAWQEPRIEVTARLLQKIRLGEVLAQVKAQTIEGRTAQHRIGASHLIEDAPTASTSRRGRRPLPESFFEEIADKYAKALREKPTAPVALLADREHVSRSQVHKWLNRAKEMGLLSSRVIDERSEASAMTAGAEGGDQ